jgi:DnaJ-class molecular chaperone
MTIICDECGGQGAIIVDLSLGITEQCPVCNGNGEIKE